MFDIFNKPSYNNSLTYGWNKYVIAGLLSS